MIHVAPKSVASDGTTATSPPFSPFSPATSVASDNTGTSDDHSTEPADLGAFHSVFRALSQLQVSHPPRTMTSLATIPSLEEDDDDDDTDRNFNSDDDSDRWASAIDDEQDEDGDVVTPSRDQHHRLGSSDTEGASSRNTDESSDEQVATAYTYDVESAVEAEDSRTIWNHEPIASYLVSAATPAPDRQAAKLRQLGGYGGGRGTYVDAQMNEQVPMPTSFIMTHEALLNQTHALAQQTLVHPPVEPQTYSTEESSPAPSAPYYTTSRRAASGLPPVTIPTSSVPHHQHIPRTPGPGDPNLGALEQALEFLAAERTRVASQLDSSIEEYAYRTTEGKRRRRKRKKGVREEAAVPPGVTLALARSTSNLHLNNPPVRSGNSNNSGSAHERTDTAVPSPSEGTSFSSSSADPRNVRRSYLHDPTEVPPVPVLHQQQRRPSTGTAYSAGPGMNSNMLAHEIIASYSVPTPPPTGRRGPRRTHTRGSSFEAQQAAAAGYPPRVGYDPRNGPLVDPRLQSIGQRLSGGSGSGSSPTNMEQSGDSKVARLRMLASNLANHFPEDAGALRRAAEGGGGTGFERQESLLYVFVDHSNILVGFLEYLKKNPQLLPPSVGSPRRLKPKILHTALVLMLERGRP
ncbi:hypothetical protein FRC11_009764, partial [Ceratobasidium sp. 423]